MGNIRFMYVRDSLRRRVGCLVMQREGTMIKYQVSVLNPVDKFDREVGKKLALQALVVKPILLEVGDVNSGHELSRRVMNDLTSNSKHRPTRAVKFARAWIKNNSFNPDSN